MTSTNVAEKTVASPVDLKDIPISLKDKLIAACDAIRTSHAASRAAYAAIYDLCLTALEKGSGLTKFCANNGIIVRETYKGQPINPFILPVKLATGVMATEDGKSHWVVDDSRVNKYATMFALAKEDNVAAKDFVGWLDKLGGVDKAVDAYRNRHPSTSESDLTPEQEKALKARFEEQLQTAVSQLRQQFGFGDQTISIQDMGRHGIKPGKHTMYVEIDENGTVIPIGLANDQSEAVSQRLVRLLPTPTGTNAPELDRILSMMGGIKGTKAVAIITNDASGCRVKIVEPGTTASVVIVGSFGPIPYLPMGQSAIDKATRVTLAAALKGLKSKKLWTWEASANGIVVKPVDGSVEGTLTVQNKGKAQSGEFRVPAAATKTDGEITLPLAVVPAGPIAEFNESTKWSAEIDITVDDAKKVAERNKDTETDFSTDASHKAPIRKGVGSTLLSKLVKGANTLKQRSCPAGAEFVAVSDYVAWTAQLAVKEGKKPSTLFKIGE
ncbi:hypothetical protein [Magnetospirillum sp. ME-1]|uniref:hypothetical protein n=1 Tax=Magnetospirillum sp. ME-1 TaxID=1639348 RepID=UPI0011AEAA88|nr:hypothetical protein [Magnetospirillum sp. ME-1]